MSMMVDIINKHRALVLDLEWKPDGKYITPGPIEILGLAASGEEAFSSFNVAGALKALKTYDGLLIGHNIIEADFVRMGHVPPSYSPEHVFDTMLAGHLIYPHLAELGLLSLGSLCRMHFPMSDWKTDKEEPLIYNGRDCAYTWKLYEALRDDLIGTDQLHLLEKQQRLALLSAKIRSRGVAVDPGAIREFHANWQDQRERLATAFPFNPNSAQQVIAWAKAQGITLKDSRYETIERMAYKHETLQQLLKYKDEGKSLKVWFDDDARETGYIHPSFNVTGTAVARFSCSEPNCQNIPPHLRHIIVPRSPELELVSFDFSQIENRCIAFLAHDETMLRDFASGTDFHKLSASRIYNKPTSEVTHEERQIGKITIHATNYLETAHHLARRLYGDATAGSVAKARGLQAAYFNAYPRIGQWHAAVSRQLDSGDIQLSNPFGRKRCIYAANSHERAKRGAHYLGCSSAADYVNGCMLTVDDMGVQPLLVVHDEIVVELPKGDMATIKKIKAALEQPVAELDGLCLPVKVKKGDNYGEMQEVDTR